MKKLLIIVIVITLPLIAFFQYSNYRRFNPPVNYDYPLSEEIDVLYYDKEVLKEYYKNAIEIGQLARTLWFNEEIDIRFPDLGDSLSMNYSKYYIHLQSRNQFLEAKLRASKIGRDKGWSNDEIKLMEQGINPDEMKIREESLKYVGLTVGSVGVEVKDIQQLLIGKGYNIPIDAVFGIATLDVLKSFQEANGLLATGVIDYKTYDALKK